jgi:hypothetical protein
MDRSNELCEHTKALSLHTGPRAHPAPLFNAHRRFFALETSSGIVKLNYIYVKNEWSSTLTPLYAFTPCTGTLLFFTYRKHAILPVEKIIS